ncbi:MDR family MFS transporter [Bacillus salacetis]|uniref:MDR family MFS transporter n=1 Tax=Bacillus salacetis TaxID=2315464 RepID=UPI0014439403|nr:MFS transporter [Bacillus salacetis]
MNTIKRYIGQFHPIVWVLLTGTILSRGAMFMTMPFLAIYLSRTIDMHPLLIGLTVGISPLVATAGGFVGGHLSDRYGRKPILTISLFTISLVFFGFSLATHPVWFIVLNALNGLSNSFFEPTSQALIADLTEKKKRMKAYSLRYTAINIGAAVGPLLGAYLANISAESTFIITGIIYFAYALALTALLGRFQLGAAASDKLKVTFLDALNIVKKDSALRYLIFGIILINIGYSQLQSTLPMHLEESLENGVYIFSILLSVNATMVVFLQMPVSAIAERFRPMHVMVFGSLLMMTGLAGFGFTAGWFLSLLSVALLTMGEILIFPANSVLIDRLAPERLRGIYFGAGQFRKVGNFAGPVLGGFLFSEAGGSVMLWTVSIIALASIIFFSLGNRSFIKVEADVAKTG